ncbi:hypothetical protein [Geminocystis sp. NIES-3709]|uniref:hypothetical protein n=1 Tax=Geminocystis sp. NIES-3709 TaxID=1617448 RepID=UPI0005FC534C|nr:hypothetical protein [Geminocystis sp. NIES-3709]BAQ66319.1 hypothetical protein GM3709_3084 [Geminocystis sp. NIES-3709]
MVKNKVLSWLTIIIFSVILVGCNDSIESVQAFNSDSKPPIPNVENIAEVAPPLLIQQLNENFAQTQPQVKILSPQNDEVLNTNNVSVDLEVKGLDIFKNEELQMGPHLHFFVDDKPYQAIYSTANSIELTDLAPGTHTIRVFASRPWHESFKNEGAYAQTTFHVFTATEDNNPAQNQPLLTYSRPQGVYSAEPIMLDFYLTNTPLHVVATENPNDEIVDWRIRVTINGESFLLDTWQPIYLTGFNKGQNWVKLEFIDENGNVIKNAFNSTVRVIDFQPKVKDTLAKLVTNKISLTKAQAITIKDYPITEEEVTPEETKVEEVTPEEIKIEEVTPEEIKIEEVTPEEIKIEEVTPEEIKVEEATPEEIKVEEVTPEEIKVEEVTPEEIKVEKN